MFESAALLGAVSACVFWTSWREKQMRNLRDSRFMALVGVFLLAGAATAAVFGL